MNKSVITAIIATVMVLAAIPMIDWESSEATETASSIDDMCTYDDGVLTITLTSDVTGNIDLEAINSESTYDDLKTLIINGDKHTLKGYIVLDAKQDGNEGDHYSVIIKNLTLDGKDASKGYGIVLQNQEPNKTGVTARTVDFSMENCTVQNFTSKGIYLVNVTSVNINNVNITDCATTPNKYVTDGNFRWYTAGDYAVDIDVTGTECSMISVTNATFSGNCGDLGAIKIAQRGGAADGENMGTASIDKVVLNNLNFDGVTNTKNDIVLGSEPNVTDENTEEMRDYNSAFPVELDTSTGTSLAVWGSDRNGDDNLDLDIAANSSLSTVPTTSEKNGSISITLERGSATASGKLGTNMSLTAGSGTSIAFVDFQNTGGNTIRIESGADYSGNAGDNVYVEPTPPPGYDDDEDLPPFFPTQPTEDDNTVTIVACAAAAAVAAILAVFLVIDRKP